MHRLTKLQYLSEVPRASFFVAAAVYNILGMTADCSRV